VRPLPILAAGIGVAIAITVYAGYRHDERLWRDYKLVRPGMSVAQAKAILGEPSWQERCGKTFPYGYAANCTAELGYRAAFAPFNPLYWVVQIDSRNRVIASDWIGSP